MLHICRRQSSRLLIPLVTGLSVGCAIWNNRSKPVEMESAKKSEVTTKKFLYYTGQHLREIDDVCVFSGTGNIKLSESIAHYLGISLSKVSVGRFADGECQIKVNETVRGKHVVIIQSLSPPNVNDAVIELMLMVSTMRRASAKSITVVVPYCAYARSNQKLKPRTPIASSDLMRMLESMGTDRLICVDMHAGQMEGFLPPSVNSDNITAIKVGAAYFGEKEEVSDQVVIVAPSAEAVPRAKDFWNSMILHGKPNAKFAMVIRKPNLENVERAAKSQDVDTVTADEYEIVGSDVVNGNDVIIVNDIVDSARSTCNVAATAKANGANNVYAFATHGLFTGKAIQRIDRSELSQILVTNTVATDSEHESSKIVHISLAPLLAEAIRRVCEQESLRHLFSSAPSN